MKTLRFLFSLMVGALSLTTPPATALTVTSGFDVSANGTSPRPQADAASASFARLTNALGASAAVTFENAMPGFFTSLSLAPGVTLSGEDRNGRGQSIRSSPEGRPDSLYGFNTTTAGRNFLYLNGGSVTLTFANPVVAFGAYFSGVQYANELVMFDDGSGQTAAPPFNFQGGGVSFLGFTNFRNPVSTIVFSTIQDSNPLGDLVGIDDIQYVTAVPEPNSLSLILLGLAAGKLRRRNILR